MFWDFAVPDRTRKLSNENTQNIYKNIITNSIGLSDCSTECKLLFYTDERQNGRIILNFIYSGYFCNIKHGFLSIYKDDISSFIQTGDTQTTNT